MAELWFYSRDDGPKSGPFSDRQLRDLADADLIRRTDTVWRQGTAQGVSANKVKYLFTAVEVSVASAGAPADSAVAATSLPDGAGENAVREGPCPSSEASSTAEPAASAHVVTDLGPVAGATAPEPAAAARPSRPRPAPPRRARATAGRGAEIVGQDGTTVKFRKRCVACGHHDTCWHTMPIVNGVTRVSFYCPKCRKSRGAEIHGSLS